MGNEASASSVGAPQLSVIVAASENGVIGRDGDLPWRLSADLKRFKALTMGHALIMGRKTFDSIGKPLPGRRSIVLTRSHDYDPGHDKVLVARSLGSALSLAQKADEVDSDVAFVIGGGEIYRLALPLTETVHLTRVHTHSDGDATFPKLDPTEWKLADREKHEADEKNEHAFTFETWRRKRAR